MNVWGGECLGGERLTIFRFGLFAIDIVVFVLSDHQCSWKFFSDIVKSLFYCVDFVASC